MIGGRDWIQAKNALIGENAMAEADDIDISSDGTIQAIARDGNIASKSIKCGLEVLLKTNGRLV